MRACAPSSPRRSSPLIAVLVFGLAPHFSSPEAHAGVIATIDEKIDNVLTLTAGSAGASALISAIRVTRGRPSRTSSWT